MEVHKHHDEDLEAGEQELKSVFWTGIFLLTLAIGVTGAFAFGIAALL